MPEDKKDRAYLGLTDGKTFTLKQIKVDLVMVEILSVYCPSCQLQAPVYNKLFNLIENDPKTKGRIKIIGIAAGNGNTEIRDFRDKHHVPFPILPDQYFEMHRAIGGSRTPFTIYVRQDPSGHAGIVTGTHLGTNQNYKNYLLIKNPVTLDDMRLDRIMYGSDFPNIPYAWDREIKWFKERNFSYESMELILWKNAFDFFNIR